MRNNNSEMQSIEERLRAERPARQASEGLTDRVMANLASDGPSEPPVEIGFWPRFALGFATVSLLAAASFQFMKRGSESPSTLPQTIAAVPAEPLNFAMPKLKAVPIENLSMHLDQPLEKELQNVISDTRLAIQFVASSFLPEN